MQEIELPVKYTDLEDGQVKFKVKKYPILDPHTVIAFLFNVAKLELPMENIRRYWQHSAAHGEEWARTIDSHERIPLGIFGDGARVTTHAGVTNIVGIFMNVIHWRPASVRSSRFLLFAIGEGDLWNHHTLNKVYRRLTWSFNTLWAGVHPDRDPWGHELPEKMKGKAGSNIVCDGAYKFAVTEIRGDWSYHKKVFRFKNTSWNSINTCHWCRAKSTGPYKDVFWNLETTSSWYDRNLNLDDWCEEKMPTSGI